MTHDFIWFKSQSEHVLFNGEQKKPIAQFLEAAGDKAVFFFTLSVMVL